jgi:hypothetical protein
MKLTNARSGSRRHAHTPRRTLAASPSPDPWCPQASGQVARHLCLTAVRAAPRMNSHWCSVRSRARSAPKLESGNGTGNTLTLLAERWLRHLRRIPGALRRRDKWLDIFACIFVKALGDVSSFSMWLIIGAAHETHQCTFGKSRSLAWFLKQDHVERKHLRRNAIIKWIIVGTAIAAAIAFVAKGTCQLVRPRSSSSIAAYSAAINHSKTAAADFVLLHLGVSHLRTLPNDRDLVP